MQKLFLTLVLILLPLVSSAEELIEGSMNCEVTYQITLNTNDGKPQISEHNIDRYKKGDFLVVKYSFGQLGLHFEVNDKIRKRTFNQHTFGLSDLVSISDSLSMFVGRNMRMDALSEGALTFGKNFIRYSDFFSQLRISRYYKGDWGGTVINDWGPYVEMSSLDCRPINDKVDKIFDVIDAKQKVLQ